MKIKNKMQIRYNKRRYLQLTVKKNKIIPVILNSNKYSEKLLVTNFFMFLIFFSQQKHDTKTAIK